MEVAHRVPPVVIGPFNRSCSSDLSPCTATPDDQAAHSSSAQEDRKVSHSEDFSQLLSILTNPQVKSRIPDLLVHLGRGSPTKRKGASSGQPFPKCTWRTPQRSASWLARVSLLRNLIRERKRVIRGNVLILASSRVAPKVVDHLHMDRFLPL